MNIQVSNCSTVFKNPILHVEREKMMKIVNRKFE